MKKLIYVLFIFGLMAGATSCKKDSEPATDTNYFVKFKKDGTWVTWTIANGEIGPDGFDPSKVDFGVAAMSDDGKDRIDIDMQQPGSTFTTGTYDSDNIATWFDYKKDINTFDPVFYSLGANGTEISRYHITISSITTKVLEGSFTGNFIVNDDGDRMNITEGQFRVERVR